MLSLADATKINNVYFFDSPEKYKLNITIVSDYKDIMAIFNGEFIQNIDGYVIRNSQSCKILFSGVQDTTSELNGPLKITFIVNKEPVEMKEITIEIIPVTSSDKNYDVFV